jgi:DNA-binding MarR family transcriptional regulator
MTILAINDESDFTSLKKQLEVSDGNLGAHMNVLENAGYIKVEKSFVNRRPKTTYKITEPGRKAFGEHLKQLEAIIKKVK